MQGTVVSDKNNKTLVVSVERIITHPVFKKQIRKSKRFHAHDEIGGFKVGDLVQIQECPPKSKLKRFEVIGAGSKD
jgi:small subunit ribosomal protein S17